MTKKKATRKRPTRAKAPRKTTQPTPPKSAEETPEIPGGLSDRVVELRRARAGDLEPHPLNWRQHGDAQLAALDGILSDIGIADVVLAFPADGLGADGDFSRLMIFDGHARTERDADQEWPVLVTDLTRAEADKMLLALDPISAMAGTDAEALTELLDGVSTEFDGLSAMFADMRAALPEPEREVTETEVPPVPDEAKTEPGDLWLLGQHRLLCGDSTKAGDVEALMGGAKAKLFLTDPPYNVALGMNETVEEAKARNRRTDGLVVSNDEMSDEEFRTFLVKCFAIAFDAMLPGAAYYIWHADSEGFNFRGAVRDCGEQVRQCLIWAKDVLVMGRQDYQWQHEPCLYGWKKGGPHAWHSDRKQTTLLQFDRPSRNPEHPTMKPIALFAYLMTNSTAAGEIVYDAFLGSGTTLIAAEQLGRRCYGMELSPQYCDVIVKRWELLTGETAKRENVK